VVHAAAGHLYCHIHAATWQSCCCAVCPTTHQLHTTWGDHRQGDSLGKGTVRETGNSVCKGVSSTEVQHAGRVMLRVWDVYVSYPPSTALQRRCPAKLCLEKNPFQQQTDACYCRRPRATHDSRTGPSYLCVRPQVTNKGCCCCCRTPCCCCCCCRQVRLRQ
jgi:hypothetical protein